MALFPLLWLSIEHEAEHDRTFTKGLVASSFQMQYSGFASEIWGLCLACLWEWQLRKALNAENPLNTVIEYRALERQKMCKPACTKHLISRTAMYDFKTKESTLQPLDLELSRNSNDEVPCNKDERSSRGNSSQSAQRCLRFSAKIRLPAANSESQTRDWFAGCLPRHITSKRICETVCNIL